VISAEIEKVAPGLFTAAASGQGVAAATANGAPIFLCATSGCVSVPIDLGSTSPVYLSLYGTGIRHVSSLANVVCTIGGVSVPVLYAGAQGEFAGLDQLNVQIPLALRGSGEVDLNLTVDGQPANTVRVNLK